MIKNFKSFNESNSENINVAVEYYKSLYKIGCISSDVHDQCLPDIEDIGTEGNTNGLTEIEIKVEVLNFLNDVGGISSDVYEMEMDEL